MALDTRTRTQLLLSLARMGVSDYHALKLARYSSRLDTLNVALCNGDWPCDNGERKTQPCSRCEMGYAPSAMVKDRTQPKVRGPGEPEARWIPVICPDCRTQDLVRAVCLDAGLTVEFAGDPRGMPFKVERAQGVSK